MTSEVLRKTESLEVAERHWAARHREQPVRKPFTIALTREAGTPGTAVGHEVGRRLGWPVYDHELVDRIAQEMGLRAKLLESVDEKRKSLLLESVEGFTSARSPSELAYVRHLTQTVLSLGAHGQCVIVGRGAAQLLAPETTLRVRLIGNLDDRIAAAARRFNLTQEKAAEWVTRTDQERRTFVLDHYLKDPTDPHHHDQVLNTSRWSVEDCAELITQGLKELMARP